VTIVWQDSADFSFVLTKTTTPTLYDEIILTLPQFTVAPTANGSVYCAVAFSARPGTVYPGSTIGSSLNIGEFTIDIYPNPIVAPGALHVITNVSDAPQSYGAYAVGGPTALSPGLIYDLSYGLEFHITGCFNDTTEYIDGCVVACLDDEGTPDPTFTNITTITGAIDGTGNAQRFAERGGASGVVDTYIPTDSPPLQFPEKMFGVAGMASRDLTPAIIDFSGAPNWTNVITRTRNTPGPCLSTSATHVISSSSATSDIVAIGSVPVGATQITVGLIVQLSGIFSTAPIATVTITAVDSSGVSTGTLLTVTTPSGGGFGTDEVTVTVPAATAGIRASYQWTGGTGIISISASFFASVDIFCNQDTPYTYAATIARYTGILPDPGPGTAPVAYNITTPTPISLSPSPAPGFGSGDWAVGILYNYIPVAVRTRGTARVIII